MSNEGNQLPANDAVSILTETEKNKRLSVPVPVPGALDVLMNDQCTSLYEDSSGNRRMNDVILKYRAPFHLATGEERSRIVETALAQVIKGGAQFLREISMREDDHDDENDKACIRWEEASRVDAKERIQCALQTPDVGMLGERQAYSENAAFPVSEGFMAVAKVHLSRTEHDDDNDVDNSNEDIPDVQSDDSRKKQRIQPDARRSTQRCDIVVSCPQPGFQDCDSESTIQPITTSSQSDSYYNAQVRLLPTTSGELSTLESAAFLQQSLDSLLNEIVYHLSRAVSAAGLLAYLHSLEVGTSNSLSTMEIYDAIAPLVEQLTDVTIPPWGISPPGLYVSPSLPPMTVLSSEPTIRHVVATANTSEDSTTLNGSSSTRRPLSGSTIPNQELLRSAHLLSQTFPTSGNMSDSNRNQLALQVMNMLLQALSCDPPTT